ncbi:uncharacterized protein LOC131074644 isoform X3 [Cryptomeria japonica]|uniref:uncharacterized protein LOC131074644 isoform X3 n=1 Tax=Cryptomeria japonica TaxID=3369 RepID=UPI0027DA0E4F|nr:uncharacterized protein LOC131074644 isoform X3 [Cryptomeria japonica]
MALPLPLAQTSTNFNFNINMVSTLASQIGFLLRNVNEANYRSVAYQLTRFAGYGLDCSIVLLQSCLDQVNLRDGDVQNMQLKLELLSVVVRHLVHQPNFSTVFCQAVQNTHITEDILGDLSKALHLSLPEQLGLGFALADSDNINRSHEGQNFCKAKIMELCQNPTSGISEDLIERILLFLHQSEGLSKHVPSFLQALSLLEPKAQMSLLLKPLFKNDVNAVNTSSECRSFQSCASNLQVSDTVLTQLEEATDVASIMEELGYGCTIDVAHCKDVLSLFCPLTEKTVSKIISTIVRTHTGLVDAHGTHGTFYSSLFSSSTTDCSWLTSWNIDVLLDSIKELAPDISWVSVMEALDHEGFYLPDQQSFSMLMSTYAKICQDPFPVQTVCGNLWKNDEGQLSFLRFAVSASPEILTFANSRRLQAPLEGPHGNKLPFGSMNQAWLSVDLVEVLCHLAEMGHGTVVHSMFEYPINHCPETLLVVVAQVKTNFNILQHDIFSTLFPLCLGGSLNSSIILNQLWHINPHIVLWSMMDIHSKDPSSISKIADACQEIKALPLVLDMTPFSFAIELAAFASRREYLNLETWLNDNLSTHRDTLFEACLKFLRERTLFEASNDALGNPVQRSGPIVNLSLDTTASFFKVLQSNVGQLESRDLVEEMKRLHSAMVRVNPRLLSVGAAEQSPSEVFAADIDEESNSYFQKIYVGQMTIDALVQMLACFKESSEKREQEIFACMIQSLFDEYRFFTRYPERELRMTGILFGSIIKHQIVSSLTLGIALRCVLDALRKPLDSKMFSFGFTALEQFVDRLVEWPQYCNHILQISHVRDAHGELIEFIERALARSSSSHPEPTVGNPPSSDQHQSSISLPASDTIESIVGPTTPQSALAQRQQGIPASYVRQSSLLATGQTISVNGQIESGPGLKSSQVVPSQQAGSGSTSSTVSNQGFLCNSRGSTVPVTRQTLNSFGHALNIETLVAAAEKRDAAIEAPGPEVQDKIAFMINNISTTNLEAKSKEFLEILKDQYYPWFAQYMVMKRASIEPNFHDLYLKFLDKINSKLLHKEIIKATYENCKVLLKSELIKSSSEERSLLKNLGSWLGKLTIGRNQALRAREIDPKLLIIEAYEKGLMIAVIPFTSKILEPCQSSLAYQPPNPWTMGILSLLAEIYALPNLKMNLRFDIEVLFKNLGVETKDVKPTQLLKGRAREIEGNPDFSNKDLGASQQVGTEHTTGTVSSISQVELQPEVSASHPSAPHAPVLPQFSAALHLSSSTGGEDEKVSTLAGMPDRMPAGLGLSHATPAQSPFPVSQFSIPISNIGAYVVVNQKLNALGQQLPFQRIVPVAMERAIREIISPVVERSVTIACMTSRELVTKDYAMESEESRIRESANKMVASLAGSLAHVTCKEPLRVAMANHLRSLLQQLNVVGEVLEQAVQLVTNDNLDLGCAVIEQAATEKALRDLEDVIGPALSSRRKQRETLGPAFYDATVYSKNLARLPEALRPKPGRLSSAQQRVYEDFARLPWQNQPTQSSPVAPSGSSNSNAGSLGSAFSRVVYGSASAQGSSSGYNSTQTTSGLGVVAQPLEQSSEELDSRAASPHSASGSQIAMADGGLRQIPDMLVSSSLTTNSSAIAEGNILENSSSTKESGPMVRPSTPTSAIERLSSSGLEPSLNTGEALDKYELISQKLEAAISMGASEQELQGLVSEIPEIILQCISRDEAALAIAQKVFKRLYENASNSLHVSTHMTILSSIRDVCKRVVKELTSWVIYSDEERKFNKDITVGLIRSELINLTEYNIHLAKLVDGGRNASATEFAIFLVQTCVVQEPGVSVSELFNLIEALGKVAQRPGSPESLLQLIEDVKNMSLSVASQTASLAGKEEKARQSRDKKATLGRAGTTRDDSKIINRDGGFVDPPGFREQVAHLFEEWARICDSPGVNDKAYAVYMSHLQQTGMLKGDDVSDRFFRVLTELAVGYCLVSEVSVPSSIPLSSQQIMQGLSFTPIDMYTKLVVLLVKYYAVDSGMTKVNLLNKVLAVTVRVIQRDAEEKKNAFHPRPYFRLFVNWLMDFNSPDPALDASNFQVLTAFANAFHSLQPLRVPGWSFAWLELICHRSFMPKLLLSNNQKGWPFFQRLLVDLFKFMEPYLRNAELSDPVRLLYKGTLRVLLVLLHDFSEFLCDYHFSFCDVIPPSCIQMRNLILSAFPRNMRLPDPFTPNLKVDLLPEISQSPRILSEVDAALKSRQMKTEVDEYLKTRQPMSMLIVDMKNRVLLPQHEAASAGTRYNVPLINSLVLYVGMQQLQSKSTPQQLAVPTAPIHSAPMDIFQRLILDLDTEGRYLFLNAVANQLRYPNNHTHYFSCVLLYLFAEANQEMIQEQITRVLLERLIVNRPHPWGLLITFIELIKNPRYDFWNRGFTRCAPEIEKLFESVARSCMGPALKPVESDISSSISADSNH